MAHGGAKHVSSGFEGQVWVTVAVGTEAVGQPQGMVTVSSLRHALTGQVGQRAWLVMVGQAGWASPAAASLEGC